MRSTRKLNSTRRSLASVSAGFAMCLIALFSAPTAMAQTPPTSATSLVTVVVAGTPLKMSPAMAAKVSSPKGFATLSPGELAAVGIGPGMHEKGVPAATAGGGGVIPMSSSGCNSLVCIYITGTGLKVTDWDTSAGYYSYLCTYAAFWNGSRILTTSNTVCTTGPFFAVWGVTRNYVPGTQLCNTWVGISGRPCETIHS